MNSLTRKIRSAFWHAQKPLADRIAQISRFGWHSLTVEIPDLQKRIRFGLALPTKDHPMPPRMVARIDIGKIWPRGSYEGLGAGSGGGSTVYLGINCKDLRGWKEDKKTGKFYKVGNKEERRFVQAGWTRQPCVVPYVF